MWVLRVKFCWPYLLRNPAGRYLLLFWRENCYINSRFCIQYLPLDNCCKDELENSIDEWEGEHKVEILRGKGELYNGGTQLSVLHSSFQGNCSAPGNKMYMYNITQRKGMIRACTQIVIFVFPPSFPPSLCPFFQPFFPLFFSYLISFLLTPSLSLLFCFPFLSSSSSSWCEVSSFISSSSLSFKLFHHLVLSKDFRCIFLFAFIRVSQGPCNKSP